MLLRFILLTCAWVMTDVVRRVGMSRTGAGLMVTEIHIMCVLVVRSRVLVAQGSEPRLSPRLSLLMSGYTTTTATAVYTCTQQHVHNSSVHMYSVHHVELSELSCLHHL